MAATRAERQATGEAARTKVPPGDLGTWTAAPDRPDPIALLEEQATTRIPDLVPVRYGRMAVTPFTFYRGAALPMAADLSVGPRTDIEVQLCGDAHLVNFGLFASPERDLLFDINDFDETLHGPFEFDLKRSAASLVVAGRSRGFDKRDNKHTSSTGPSGRIGTAWPATPRCGPSTSTTPEWMRPPSARMSTSTRAP